MVSPELACPRNLPRNLFVPGTCDRPEFIRGAKAIARGAAQCVVAVDTGARLLLSAGEAAVDGGLVEPLWAIERIRAVLRGLAQVIEQPGAGGLEALVG